MKSLVLFFTAVFFFSGASYASKDMSYKEYILNEFKKQKELFSKTDSESRKIKSLIYETAKKLEKLNDEDRDLREKILITKAKISERLSGLKVKQEVIEAEKKKIFRRLRLLSIWYKSGVGDLLFSSTNIKELDKRMYYLRKILQSDAHRLKSYSSDARDFDKERGKLKLEIKKMAAMRSKLKKNEKQLDRIKKLHSRALAKVTTKHKKAARKLKAIRKKSSEFLAKDLLQKGFMERKGTLDMPIEGSIVMDYGLHSFHNKRVNLFSNGIGIVATGGRDVQLIASGRVSYRGYVRGYGNTVIVDHGDRYYSVYGYLENIDVKLGEKLAKGDRLGRVGEKEDRAILYFELRKFSEALNPIPWFKKDEIKMAKSQIDLSTM